MLGDADCDMHNKYHRRAGACLIAALVLVAAVRAHAADGDKTSTARTEPKPPPDIALILDERGIRAAGIGTLPIERERGGADLLLPGTVAIPQQQIRVVAAPAGGLVEEMLVSAEGPVKTGQPIARLRSPAIVEAQRQFLAAIADEALSADRLRRSELLFEGK